MTFIHWFALCKSSEVVYATYIDNTYHNVLLRHLQYRTYFDDFARRDASSTRVLLHFGAIDWQSTVYVNNVTLATHTGGYDSFTLDVTDVIQDTNNELYVVVYDPSDEGAQPNGKQKVHYIYVVHA